MVEQEQQFQKQRNRELTGFGITAKHLWLIIGLNAIISAAISLLVVLVVGPWAYTGAVSGLFSATPDTAAQQPVAQGTPLDALNVTTNMTPTLTLTPTQPPEPILYEVLPGDSLSEIAFEFGIPVETLMEANAIDNPDALQAGETIIIPVGGLTNATPTFTPEPVETETSIPFDPPTPENEELTPAADVSVQPTETPTVIPTATAPPIGEVRVSIENVLGYGQLSDEVVVIFNEGPGVNLSGWKLAGSSQGEFDFPNLFLWNGGSVRVHTSSGTNTPSDLFWGQEEAFWFSGDTLQLIDGSGEEISSYVIP